MKKSAHFDETAHLMSGYFMLKKSDFRVNTANMIVSQKLAALPLLLSDVNPPSTAMLKYTLGNEFTYGGESFILGFDFLNNAGNNSRQLLFKGRMMMILVGLFTAILVFSWSKKLFGTIGAMISLTFLVTCPVFISFSGIISADISAAMLFLAVTRSYWTVLHKVTPFTVAVFAIAFALLLLTKLSSLVFVPVSVLLLLIRLVGAHPLDLGWCWTPSRKITSMMSSVLVLIASMCAVFLIVTVIIWAAYGFRYAAMSPDSHWPAKLNWQDTLKVEDEAPSLSPDKALHSLTTFANSMHLFPEAFLFDLASLRNLTKSRQAFFLGETSDKGWLLYFPFTFLAKTSLPTLLASILAIAVFLWAGLGIKRGNGTSPPWKIYECLPLFIFIFIFMIAAMTRGVNIGHRHILPIYPFIFVLLGVLGYLFRRDKLWSKLFVTLLLMGSIISAIAIHPNHMAYVSSMLGGPFKAYKMLVDSSLEWGQELPSVKKWIDEEKLSSNDLNIYFSYFGSGSPKSEGIKAERLPGYFDPLMNDSKSSTYTKLLKPGIYLISATMLQPVYYMRTNPDLSQFNFCGSWGGSYQKKYDDMRKLAEPLLRAMENSPNERDRSLLFETLRQNRPDTVPEEKVEQFWMKYLAVYDVARFAKLASYLRNREPDGHINYSVYIFLLDKKELSVALGN
jgi:hypothetical protein